MPNPLLSIPLPASRARSRLALVCDDEPAMRSLYSILLKAAGFRIQLAVDGEDALGQMRDQVPNEFDVVITDNQMPGLDGLGFVKALRAADYPGKIVVVSAHLDEPRLAAYRALRVDRIVSKMDGACRLGIMLQGDFREGKS